MVLIVCQRIGNLDNRDIGIEADDLFWRHSLTDPADDQLDGQTRSFDHPGRPGRWETALGDYLYRHVKPDLFCCYTWTEVSVGQHAFVASREKALLDLIHLEPGADSLLYLRELRLQNTEQLDLEELERLAVRAGSPKLRRAVDRLSEWAREHALEYEVL